MTLLYSFSGSGLNLSLLFQWAWPKFIFLTYRLVVAAYTLTVLVYSVIEASFTKRRHPWIAYFTYWSYVVITTHLLLSAAIAAAYFNRGRCCPRERPELEVEPTRMYDIASEAAVHSAAVEPVVGLRWHFRLDWILFDVASNTAILVTSVYFIAMYPNIEHLKTMSANDANFHLMNSVVMALELVVTAIPVRLLHYIYPLAFCLLYTVFSAVYWAVDHENTLYPGVLDWNNAPMAGVMVLITSVFLIPCNSAINFLAYQLRLSIHRKLNK